MKTTFKAFFTIIFFFLVFADSPLQGLEIQLNRFGDRPLQFASGGVLLDPDDWTRAELLQLSRQGCRPIAWLNISRIEEGRSFTANIDRKSLVAKKTKKIQLNPIVRFNLQSWQGVLRERVREIAQKGFCGLFLVGAEQYATVSDNPVARQEMIRLVSEIAKHFKNQVPDGLVIMHEGIELLSTPDFPNHVEGISKEGLWVDEDGRHTRPWVREALIKRLQQEISRGRRIFTIDFPHTAPQKDMILREAQSSGFDAGFAIFPLTIQRSKIP